MSTSETTPRTPVPAIDWARQAGRVDLVREYLDGILVQRKQRRRKVAAGAATALVLTLLGFWAVPTIRETANLVTESQRREAFVLQDGSKAELNANASLKTDFRYGRRTVELTQGEAFFSVAKDATHPFLVTTPSGTIRVTGTHFNVRLDAHGTEVTLVEGSVQYLGEGPGSAATLRPGEQLSSDGTTSVTRTLAPKQVEDVLSWRTGKLSLDGLSLGEAAARFATYHGKKITVSPLVASIPLGGSCPLDDLPEFLTFLHDTFPVSVRSHPDGSLELDYR